MNPDMPRFDKARVLVVGDAMLDRYWYGQTARISPEAPVPVVRVGAAEERPGGAGNVAVNLTALGVQATLVALVGADDAGRSLSAAIERAGVTADLVSVDGWQTITKLRVISRNQQLIRLDFEDPVAAGLTVGIGERAAGHAADADLVILSDYGKGALAAVPDLIAAVRAAGKRVLVDPKGSDWRRYRGATMLTPNRGEFEAVVGRCAGDAELADRAARVCRDLELDALLVTRSDEGMSLCTRSGVLHLPAEAREVYDVTGAGDTVIATAGAALASGQSFEDAARLANLAAGIVVGKLGAASVSAAELALALHTSRDHSVLDEPTLIARVSAARAAGERIVMTNGCFDVLHAGHVGYLDEARRLGDRLVVAVNDDASVGRLKGDGRPVNAVADRMAVLAGLAVVDWVVPFSEDTPERLVCAVRPDILVKGGDYSADDVAGGRCAGAVRILPFREGKSSSRIIAALRGRTK
ncbi:MAG: bifunctional D-glycero-beta-D-manno-heptose-7-phosphate kinase/D-glycero-beta-D-manno-heptose 1-phosphate adenylyltransferase HldE [Xanthomonadaceae bacterium]|nr:bifunctional D-glycero-beta-D-manno-heptose-7-phosphate kinase/D-glycero-beta-D-manno-heptose 1-phosphate adenylyltransferase HldE [Xanthomonadaceae bacterium]